MTRRIDGSTVADRVVAEVESRVQELRQRGVTPTLATVLASDDPAQRRFVELKHEACEQVGIRTRGVAVDPDAPTARLREAVAGASDDDAVDAVFVQWPLPDHVDGMAVREAIAPAKDVDCLHPTNLGRLVAGDPAFRPATPSAVLALLDEYDVALDGANAVVVGRSPVIGRPVAAMLLARDATVTVCHSRTADLAAHTRRADVVVTAAGVPGLVDGSMLRDGSVVVDVSANRVETGDGHRVVGDVEFDSAVGRVAAITPVPGGVGPVTLAALLRNVVLAAERLSEA